MTRDPEELAGIYAVFDQNADRIRRDADQFRTWLNGYLSGLATAAALVLAVWILW